MAHISVETQIAQMLNSYSDLTVQYDSSMIRNSSIRHLYLSTKDGIIVGVVGVQRLSPHISEIKHLVVPPVLRRHGLAKRLMKMAFKETTTPTVMTTIRAENTPSIRLCTGLGFRIVEDYNNCSGKNILILIKNLSKNRREPNEDTAQIPLFS